MQVRMFDLRVKSSKIRKDLEKNFRKILNHGMFLFGPELDEFEKKSFNIVIYANHMLRASYEAMEKVAKEILKNERTSEIEKDIISIKKILRLIPGTI